MSGVGVCVAVLRPVACFGVSGVRVAVLVAVARVCVRGVCVFVFLVGSVALMCVWGVCVAALVRLVDRCGLWVGVVYDDGVACSLERYLTVLVE